MAAKVRDDDAVAVWINGKDVAPIGADAHAAVKQHQRLPRASFLEKHVEVMNVDNRHAKAYTPRRLWLQGQVK
jgi:hypothetical protein